MEQRPIKHDLSANVVSAPRIGTGNHLDRVRKSSNVHRTPTCLVAIVHHTVVRLRRAQCDLVTCPCTHRFIDVRDFSMATRRPRRFSRLLPRSDRDDDLGMGRATDLIWGFHLHCCLFKWGYTSER